LETTSSARDRKGLPVLGRYQIVSEIGQGAMGIVYKAIDPIIDRTVAIKTINLNLSRQDLEEYEARFRQEIKAAGRLNHPNIVTLYDVGNTDKVAYMAMEFLEGQELKDMLASGNLLAVDRTVDIIVQVADGLSFAHGQGVVHRDIKPSNIMLSRSGEVKLLDLGLARFFAEGATAGGVNAVGAAVELPPQRNSAHGVCGLHYLRFRQA
jgi:serine/threonine protein kinase